MLLVLGKMLLFISCLLKHQRKSCSAGFMWPFCPCGSQMFLWQEVIARERRTVVELRWNGQVIYMKVINVRSDDILQHKHTIKTKTLLFCDLPPYQRWSVNTAIFKKSLPLSQKDAHSVQFLLSNTDCCQQHSYGRRKISVCNIYSRAQQNKSVLQREGEREGGWVKCVQGAAERLYTQHKTCH